MSFRKQFLSDVLVTGVEGGIGYWSEARNYRPSLGTVTLIDPEEENFGFPGDDAPRYVDASVIERGLELILTGEIAFYPSGYENLDDLRLANRTNGEDGDYDAEIADAVIQAGLFGELVFG